MLLLLVASALAQEAEETETDPAEESDPERVELEVEDDLGSALDDFGAVQLDGDEGSLEDFAVLTGGLVRGRWYGKPLLSVSHLSADDPRTAVRLGAALGHQWWILGEQTLQIGGDTVLEATAPVGGASGHRVALSSVVGPWLGPVGLRLGPGLRWDRTDWGDGGVLDTGLGLGPRLSATAALGQLRPSVGLAADWFVAGARTPADPATATLPVLGHETTWSAGLAWLGRPVAISLQGDWRETAVGPVIDVGLGLHLRPF